MIKKEPVSRARLDRIYVSRNLLTVGAPTITSVTHLRPADDDLTHLKENGTLKKSDHAAVTLELRYTNLMKAPQQWRMPHWPFSGEDVGTARKMREEIASTIENRSADPVRDLEALLQKIQRICREAEKKNQSEHAARRTELQRRLIRIESALGDGVKKTKKRSLGEAEVAMLWTEREHIEGELRGVREKEYRRWCGERAFEVYQTEDRCNRRFFEEMKEDHKPTIFKEIRRPDKDDHTCIRRQASMNKEAARFFSGKGGYFNRDTGRDPEAEEQLLDALGRDGKKLPDWLKDELKAEVVLGC